LIHQRYSTCRCLLSFPTRRSSDLCKMRMPKMSLSKSPMNLNMSPKRKKHGPCDRIDHVEPAPSLRPYAEQPSWTDLRKGPNLVRSEEHTSELQSRFDLVCRLLLEK